MKRINFIKKIFLFVLIVVLFLCANHALNEGYLGTFISTYTSMIVNRILWILGSIYVGTGIANFVNDFVVSKSKKIWKRTISDVKIGLEQKYKKHVAEMENVNINFLKFVIHYFIAQKNEEQINYILSALRDEFYNKSCSKDEISYFFLSERKNNNISAFLYSNPQFKRDCENVSHELSKRNSYIQLPEQDDKSHLLNVLSTEILHMSLLENYCDIGEKMDYLCKIFSWIYAQIAAGMIQTESVSFLSFLQSLPCLEEKIESLEVDHEILFLELSKIKNSNGVRKAIRYAERSLREGIKHSIDECICFAGTIMKYPEKFSLIEQVKFCKTVERVRKAYREHYYNYCEYSMIILLMASPLGMKSPVDNVDGMIAIITDLMKVCGL